jgi:hypothetical protein
MINDMKNVGFEISHLSGKRPESPSIILDTISCHSGKLIEEIWLQIHINYFTIYFKRITQAVGIEQHAETPGFLDISDKGNFHVSSNLSY